MQMRGAIEGTSQVNQDPPHSGYAAGYAAIAIALSLALLLTLPIAARPVARLLGSLSLWVLAG